MRIVHDKDVPFIRSETQHREPNIEFKRLLQGTPGSPQNYEFTLAKSPGRFLSPRHHHNFDQIRLCLDGKFGDGKATDLAPGEVGYYGEGGYYSIDSTDSLVLLLQFGGANGDGFTSYSDLFRAYHEMTKLGEFRNGVFFRNQRTNLPPDVKPNQDGYEALWQHINGKPVTYREPRYRNPVIMNPAHAAALPDAEQAGVFRSTLGVFTERLIDITQIKVTEGAVLAESAPRAPKLGYVLSGEAETEGDRLIAGTAFEIATGETLHLTAQSDLHIQMITLPWFSDDELLQSRPTAAIV
ncbi:hypothetical protein [Govanella unica]|uniref:Uncharacterized protein n=1 Tax=Govanella unica TaxID=2975056 RepID=A0A9X3TVY9_9PROT|nr:hypothetical protein [Govania unica]MDA5192564.1 hypothetical protein [Govania unica]